MIPIVLLIAGLGLVGFSSQGGLILIFLGAAGLLGRMFLPVILAARRPDPNRPAPKHNIVPFPH
jgi:hypothetical protein